MFKWKKLRNWYLADGDLEDHDPVDELLFGEAADLPVLPLYYLLPEGHIQVAAVITPNSSS